MSREQAFAIAKDFRDLRRFFSAYLHDEFDEEYGTPEAAMDAFKRDSSEAVVRQACGELREVLNQGLSERELEDVLKWASVPATSRPRVRSRIG